MTMGSKKRVKRKTVVVKIGKVYLEKSDCAGLNGEDEPWLFAVVDRATQEKFAWLRGTLYFETKAHYLEGEHENFRINKQTDGRHPKVRRPRSGQ